MAMDVFDVSLAWKKYFLYSSNEIEKSGSCVKRRGWVVAKARLDPGCAWKASEEMREADHEPVARISASASGPLPSLASNMLEGASVGRAELRAGKIEPTPPSARRPPAATEMSKAARSNRARRLSISMFSDYNTIEYVG
jgi:hypothetical protein